jgi:hypothetical protein
MGKRELLIRVRISAIAFLNLYKPLVEINTMAQKQGSEKGKKGPSGYFYIAGVFIIVLLLFFTLGQNAPGQQTANTDQNTIYQPPSQQNNEPQQQPVQPPAQQPQVTDKSIALDSHTTRSIAVRNVGTATVNTAELKVYINNNLVKCDWDMMTIPSYALRRCSFSGNIECIGGSTITVTGPTNSQTVSC